MATKPSTVPPRASATTTQASLPDWMTMPRIRSSTAMREPSSTNILEPWVRQARSDTGNLSVSLTRPSFNRLNSRSMVISLDIDAGGIGTMPFFCHSTWPVCASINSACSALVWIAARAGRAKAAQKDRSRQKRRSMESPNELLIYDDMGIVGAGAGDAGQGGVGILDGIQGTGAYSIESLPAA